MFCPKCGADQSEDLKFCNRCGANLFAVRQVVESREAGEKFDWNKTWFAEMLLTQSEKEKRKVEREDMLRAGPTPEIKRYKEIRDGIITTSVGLGVGTLLFVLGQGLIAMGVMPHPAVEIVSRMWIAGIIPTFIGLALVFNGAVIGSKEVRVVRRAIGEKEKSKGLTPAGKEYLPPAPQDWIEGDSPKFSVTDQTTRQLEESRKTK